MKYSAVLILLCFLFVQALVGEPTPNDLPAEKVPEEAADSSLAQEIFSSDYTAAVVREHRGTVAAEAFRAERHRYYLLGAACIVSGVIFILVALGIPFSEDGPDYLSVLCVVLAICFIASGMVTLSLATRNALFFVFGSDPTLWPR